MLKKQKKSFWELVAKFQKPILFICLGVFIALLVYALIFYTPFNSLYSSCDSLWALGSKRGTTETNWSKAGIDYTTLPEAVWVYNDDGTKVTNLNMTYYVRYLGKYAVYGDETIQSLNHLLFQWGLIGILVSWVLFIYRGQKRKNYYITNYIVNGAWSIFAVSMAVTLINYLTYWQYDMIHNMDIDMINKYRAFKELKPFDLNSLDWIFTIGYIIAGVMIFAAVALIVLTVAKYINTAKRKKEKAAEIEAKNLAAVKGGN